MIKPFNLKALVVGALLAIAAAGTHAQSVVVQYGNLVYQNASGATETLTETGADGNPVISPDGSLIVFTRIRPGEQENSADAGSGPLRDVYVMRLSDHAVTKIVSAAHAPKPEDDLSGINSLAFSPDGSMVYFNTAAWVTSKAIHAVPVQGGHERYVTNGNGFAVVKHGKYAGYLVTRQHRYMEGHGSWNPYVLVRPEGKEIKVLGEFGDDEPRAEMAALQSVEGKAAPRPAAAAVNAAGSGYLDKVRRRVRPNITWSGEMSGLETEIAVRCSPTGTLLSATISRSSGNSSWDDAALRAVQRSDPMPVDTDGKAPSSFKVVLRPAG